MPWAFLDKSLLATYSCVRGPPPGKEKLFFITISSQENGYPIAFNDFETSSDLGI